MSTTLSQCELWPGVRLTALQTDKFKTSMLSISLLAPLSAQHAASNALLPSVLRRGCRKYPDMLSLSASLDDLYGGVMEATVRKKGELQCLGFTASFLDDAYIPEESNILEAGMALMAQLLLDPAKQDGSFVEAYFDSERENLIQKIRSRVNDKQQYAVYRLIEQMFAGEAYGVDKLGDEQSAAAITRAGLFADYETLLQTAPIELYYCGSADAKRVEVALRAAFATLPQGKRTSLADIAQMQTAQAKARTPRHFEDRMDVTQGKLVLGFRLAQPSYTDAHGAALLQVFNALYGASTNAKLFLNVRERLSLCYYANSMVDKHKGIALVSSGIAFDQFARARDEILAQLDDCRKGVFSKEELEFARRNAVNNLRLTSDAQGRLEDFWISQLVAGRSDGPDALAQAAAALTAEDIKTLAQGMQLDAVYFLQGKEGANT